MGRSNSSSARHSQKWRPRISRSVPPSPAEDGRPLRRIFISRRSKKVIRQAAWINGFGANGEFDIERTKIIAAAEAVLDALQAMGGSVNTCLNKLGMEAVFDASTSVSKNVIYNGVFSRCIAVIRLFGRSKCRPREPYIHFPFDGISGSPAHHEPFTSLDRNTIDG